MPEIKCFIACSISQVGFSASKYIYLTKLLAHAWRHHNFNSQEGDGNASKIFERDFTGMELGA